METPLLDNPGILQVLFHPRRSHHLMRMGAYTVFVDVEPGVTLAGRLYPATPDAPLILFYHGNGEIADDYDDIASLYTRLGITLLVMDYRGYGKSTGSPTASTLLTDPIVVFEQLATIFEDHDLTPSRVYIMGRSLGSVAAIQTAVHAGDALSGLIIESGFSDTFGLLARMGVRVQHATEETDGAANAIKMRQVHIPTLILHGERDVLIPPSDGRTLYEECGAADKTLILIPGAGHNDIMMVGMQDYFQAIATFVAAEHHTSWRKPQTEE